MVLSGPLWWGKNKIASLINLCILYTDFHLGGDLFVVYLLLNLIDTSSPNDIQVYILGQKEKDMPRFCVNKAVAAADWAGTNHVLEQCQQIVELKTYQF